MTNAARRGIVTGGTWCVDNNKLIAVWPTEESSNEIFALDPKGGGSGHNFAADMRLLDPEMPVDTIGAVGDDDNGRFLLAECDRRGIGRDQLHVLQGVTQFSDAMCIRETGKRTHFYYQGVGTQLTPDHFDFGRTRARILHLGLPGVHDTMDRAWHDEPNGWVAVLRKARAAGLTNNLELVTIDRDKLAGLARPCLPWLDLLVVNDFEIGALAGDATVRDGQTDVPAVIAAARKVLEQGSMQLLAVHFPRGAVALARDGRMTVKGSTRIPSDIVVGANGAGDAFAAGFVYGVHENWPVEQSLALAHASAATSMRAMSTIDGVEHWRTCLGLAEGWGWRDAPA